VDGDIVGKVPPYVYHELESYNEVFTVTLDSISLNKTLNTSEERTHSVNIVLESLRKKNVFCALRGWRNEVSHAPHNSNSPKESSFYIALSGTGCGARVW
jgi:hypothetical protein